MVINAGNISVCSSISLLKNNCVLYFIGNIDQAQYCDKIKGLVDFLGSELSTEELNMIWKMQVHLLINTNKMLR